MSRHRSSSRNRSKPKPAASAGAERQQATAGVAAGAAKATGLREEQPAAGAFKENLVSPAAPMPRWVPWTLAALTYAGFVLALYLTFVHYRGYVSPCYVVHGCEQVQTSKYSVVLGVPVALLGTIFFGLMFYLTIGLLTRPQARLVAVFKVLAFLGALAVIPLFFLQALVLKAFCSYCIGTEILMLAIWIVSFFVRAGVERREMSRAGAAAR